MLLMLLEQAVVDAPVAMESRAIVLDGPLPVAFVKRGGSGQRAFRRPNPDATSPPVCELEVGVLESFYERLQEPDLRRLLRVSWSPFSSVVVVGFQDYSKTFSEFVDLPLWEWAPVDAARREFV